MLVIITGPMFSEKSDRLIDEYDKRHHKDKIMIFKPGEDTRDVGIVKARGKYVDGNVMPDREIPAIIISDISEIVQHIIQKKENGIDISTILIDEGNFLKGDPTILRDLSLYADIDIIISGLNQDRFQNPFGLMPELMALADEIKFLTASCNDCNRPANHTIIANSGGNKEQILVGDQIDGFMATCPRCLSRKAASEHNTPLGMSLVLKVREKPNGS